MEIYRDYHQIYYQMVMGEVLTMQIVSSLLIVSNPTQPSVSLAEEIKFFIDINTSFLGMPVLEDGLSDSENISDDELSSPSLPVITKSNNRHQSTQIDSNLLPSHKHQYTKSVDNEVQSQSKSFYIRPQVPPAAVRTDQHKSSLEESSAISTGRLSFVQTNVTRKGKFR